MKRACDIVSKRVANVCLMGKIAERIHWERHQKSIVKLKGVVLKENDRFE